MRTAVLPVPGFNTESVQSIILYIHTGHEKQVATVAYRPFFFFPKKGQKITRLNVLVTIE